MLISLALFGPPLPLPFITYSAFFGHPLHFFYYLGGTIAKRKSL